jgi:hypothetical protein
MFNCKNETQPVNIYFKMRHLLWCSQIRGICIKSVTHNSSFINLFMATCFGFNCKTSKFIKDLTMARS